MRSPYSQEACPNLCAPQNPPSESFATLEECTQACSENIECKGCFGPNAAPAASTTTSSNDSKYVTSTTGSYVTNAQLIPNVEYQFENFFRKIQSDTNAASKMSQSTTTPVPAVSMLELDAPTSSAAERGWSLAHGTDCDPSDSTILSHYSNSDVSALQSLCNSMPDCVAFNSLGYLWGGLCTPIASASADLMQKAGSNVCSNADQLALDDTAEGEARASAPPALTCMIDPSDEQKKHCSSLLSKDQCTSPCTWVDNDARVISASGTVFKKDAYCTVNTCCNATLENTPHGLKSCDGIQVCNQGIEQSATFESIQEEYSSSKSGGQNLNACVAKDTSNENQMQLCKEFTQNAPVSIQKLTCGSLGLTWDGSCPYTTNEAQLFEQGVCNANPNCVYIKEGVPTMLSPSLKLSPGGRLCYDFDTNQEDYTDSNKYGKTKFQACCHECAPNIIASNCSNVTQEDITQHTSKGFQYINYTTDVSDGSFDQWWACSTAAPTAPITYQDMAPSATLDRKCTPFTMDSELCPYGSYPILNPQLQEVESPPGLQACENYTNINDCLEIGPSKGGVYCAWNTSANVCQPQQQFTYNKLCAPRPCGQDEYLASNTNDCVNILNPISNVSEKQSMAMYNAAVTPNVQGTSTWFGITTSTFLNDELPPQNVLASFAVDGNTYYGAGAQLSPAGTGKLIQNVAMY